MVIIFWNGILWKIEIIRYNYLHMKYLIWFVRISSLLVILLGLPFYFGYGNPLPFINPNYSFLDNLWLAIFPRMFFGLALGWKMPQVAGYWLVVLLGLGLIASFVVEGNWDGFPVIMLLPFVLGVLYLVVGYKSKKSLKAK